MSVVLLYWITDHRCVELYNKVTTNARLLAIHRGNLAGKDAAQTSSFLPFETET